MSVAKISHTLQLFMNEKIQLWSMWQKFYQRMQFHQSLQFGNMYTNSSWITQNTGLKLEITAVYETKKFNCDQCGKYFARGCNLKVLIQNVHEIYSWIEF